MIVCIGEALIDFVPAVSGQALRDVETFSKKAGGAPANVAAGIAKLGGKAAFIGKVGADEFGRFLEKTLAELGVDTSGMLFSEEANTGLAFVSLRADGERDFLFYRRPSADMLLRPEEIREDLLARARIVHFGSGTLINEPAASATLAAVKRAKELGALVAFDPNLRLNLWPSAEMARERILAALPLADLVKVSEEELEFLSGHAGENREAACQQLLAAGPRLVVVTLGAKGALLCSREQVLQLNGFEVTAIDTTGAGDAFWAAFLTRLEEMLVTGRQLSGLTEGEWQEVLTFANRVGALTTTRPGAIAAIPTRAEVEAELAAAPVTSADYIRQVTVELPEGLLGRSAALFVQTAGKYEALLKIGYQNKLVDAKSILGVMVLGVRPGEQVTLYADGPEAAEALETLTSFLQGKTGSES
ncbi:fructokinase [Carboxydocella thermautotrophica]|nr:fructokinase [Carboxydocella thermautotrophica]